jgi:CDP-4-dehydro-6-deoxyglucose reductase
MPTRWYNGVVSRVETANPRVKRFFIKVDDVEKFDFLPGQFVTVDLPISEKRLGRWRSYSIANSPSDSNEIELCVVQLDGGTATEYLFEKISVGDTLKFKGPDGGFVLPENLDRDIVFLCTGTGVAPFRSMIQQIVNQDLSHKGLHLIYGGRNKDEILYEEEFLKLSDTLPGFKYDVALSRVPAIEIKAAHRHHGRIHEIYMDQYKAGKEETLFLICGWSQMIDEAVANLIMKLGYRNNQLKYEMYG